MGVTLGTGAASASELLSPAEKILAQIIDDLNRRLEALEARPQQQTAAGDDEES